MKILRIPLVIVLVVVAGRAFNANAQTETNLHIFTGPPTDGSNPYAAGLVQGGDGNFYGTTAGGGTNGDGTVFRIGPIGSYTNLYSFGSYPSDGSEPLAGLVQGSDGNFYGTTLVGGTNNDGTVYRISPSGNYTNLYSFGSSPTDGANPLAGLVQGSDGNFYGTTDGGGTSTNCGGGCGTVFRISPSGNYTNLYSFAGSPTDGANPFAGLVQGSDGNFYGTTSGSGMNNRGTVFRVSPSGNYTNLYSFAGPPTDGENPGAGLVQGSDGNLYGTTSGGGMNGNFGTVYRISPSGNYTNLYSFGVSPDGANPGAGLVQGSDGNLYGTTNNGGTNNDGTVFKLTIPLNPPANQINAIQLAGGNVIVAIPSVAGETYQLQCRNSLTSGSWSNIPGVAVTNSIGSLLTLTNVAGASQPQRFYRFDITP